MDYCFNGEPRAKAYLEKIGAFFNGIGAANIVDGYTLTGSPNSGAKNMAFIGPAGVAGMAGWPQLLDGAFMFGATNNGGDGAYYPQSLKIITMLMMSGNFLRLHAPLSGSRAPARGHGALARGRSTVVNPRRSNSSPCRAALVPTPA